MNVKKVGNELINADIITPVMSYASFNDELTESTKENITNSLKYGHEMLQIYEKHLDRSGHPIYMGMGAILEMLVEMNEVFSEYNRERYFIKKKKKKKKNLCSKI